MNSLTWDQELAADPALKARRPNVGTTVRVIEGKRLGTVGSVTWHGRDKFSHAYRHCDYAQALLRDLHGQWGYRVRVQLDDGEAFFVGAEKVCVL